MCEGGEAMARGHGARVTPVPHTSLTHSYSGPTLARSMEADLREGGPPAFASHLPHPRLN